LHQKPSLLNLDFVNNPELVQEINYMPPVGKSDHLLLEIQTLIKKITKRLVKKTFVDYKSIRADLSNVNWDNILEGHVEHKWNIFTENPAAGRSTKRRGTKPSMLSLLLHETNCAN